MLARKSGLSLLLALSLFACSRASQDDDSSSNEAAQTESFAIYPDVRAGMHRLGELSPSNTSIGDLGSNVRDQGVIASCASFGFLGLLENQMFNERGVTPDLSERFMVFSNYFQTGTLGGDPKVIATFPSIVKNVGLLTDDAWPYAPILPNANRFGQDAAQGLTDEPNAPTPLASILEPTAANSRERAEIIQKSEFLGALPKGPTPIMLPAKAILQSTNRNPEFEYQGEIYSCFAADGPESVPEAKRIAVSPREYLEMCFDLDPKSYFTCAFDSAKAEQEAEAAVTATDECGHAKQAADHMAKSMLDANQKALKLAIATIDKGQAALLGVLAPASPANLGGVWSAKNLKIGGGHAVLAIGYLTYDELASGEEQDRGMLKTGLFDKIAASVEPDYAARIQAGDLPTDREALRDVRIATKLGLRMKDEGGIVLFRNSWGSSVTINEQGQQLEIGIKGHQAMTFEFFLKTGLLSQGRQNARVPGVGWSRTSGPAFCPSVVQTTHSAWLNGDHLDKMKTHIRALAVPPTCAE
jgi:hypothetical protein